MILLSLLGCMVIAGVFAGLETGLVAANRMLLDDAKVRHRLWARAAAYLLDRPARLLGTTLIGYNIANVSAAVLLTNYMVNEGLEHLTWLAILALTLVYLVFNDLIPKSFFRRHADTLATRLSPLLVVFFFVFLPVYAVLNGIVQVLLFLTRQDVSRRREMRSKRDLSFLLRAVGQEAGLSESDQRTIEDVVAFRDQSAREVMIPLHDLVVVPTGLPTDEARRLSRDSGQRHIPVFEKRYDNIVGVFDTVRLLYTTSPRIGDEMRPVVFYPETMRIPDLLAELRRQGLDVAFLADEFGGVAGMITPSRIVADLFHYVPRHGRLREDIRRDDEGRILVEGAADVEEVARYLGVTLGTGLATTIGGYVCERLGHIPVVGEEYRERGIVFTVTESDPRRILELEARKELPRRPSPG